MNTFFIQYSALIQLFHPQITKHWGRLPRNLTGMLGYASRDQINALRDFILIVREYSKLLLNVRIIKNETRIGGYEIYTHVISDIGAAVKGAWIFQIEHV